MLATTIIKAFGVVGNILFAAACVPTAWKTARAGKSIGTPLSLSLTLVCACVSIYTYLIGTYGFDPFIWIIGIVETASWAVVLWYTLFPRFGGWSCRRVARAYRKAVLLTKERDAKQRQALADLHAEEKRLNLP